MSGRSKGDAEDTTEGDVLTVGLAMAEGKLDGRTDGTTLGRTDGTTLGKTDGITLGTPETLGCFVGMSDGSNDTVGLVVGRGVLVGFCDTLGLVDGTELGFTEGEMVGLSDMLG